jgi:transposase
MIHGAISGEHKGPLTTIEKHWNETGKGTVTAAVYREHVLPRVYYFLRHVERVEREAVAKTGIFFNKDNLKTTECCLMEDGASVHTAKLTQAEHKIRGITRIPWPANSPDLNPIENVWRLLKYRVGRRFPKNEVDCRQYIEEEWDILTVDDFKHYIESMPERVAACILAKGWHTKW